MTEPYPYAATLSRRIVEVAPFDATIPAPACAAAGLRKGDQHPRLGARALGLIGIARPARRDPSGLCRAFRPIVDFGTGSRLQW